MSDTVLTFGECAAHQAWVAETWGEVTWKAGAIGSSHSLSR